MPAWIKAARPVLEDAARTYNGRITYGELASRVQEATGIFTNQLVHYWAGVLAFNCCRPGEPLLCSLVVDAEGQVGSGYEDAVVTTYGGPPPKDLQMNSAEERLKCYRYFGADLPADGGQPTLTPQVARQRLQASSRARTQALRPVCPIHHLQLPMSGQCDLCE
jgi:hypothetical protein